MTNSADPDHLASSEANWAESTLFAKAGYMRIQQDRLILSFLEDKHYSPDQTPRSDPSLYFLPMSLL